MRVLLAALVAATLAAAAIPAHGAARSLDETRAERSPARSLSADAPADIPAFARKYRVSCSLCHAPAPRLNAFGEQFAANGFEFLPGETPRDTIATGDPELRLQTGVPLAVRFDAYLQAAAPNPSDRAGYDLQAPWGIKLLSGGQIADRVSYYMYFYMSEHGEVAGLEDAYVQFTNPGGLDMAVVVGQFQVSDPMFKRELRLEALDYAPYRLRVGEARADLTYDRGVAVTAAPAGIDLMLMVVNGRGLDASNRFRLYDSDDYKTLAGHASRDLGPLRVGLFGYRGREAVDGGPTDRITIWGPDLTVPLRRSGELNAQYLRRTDSNPYFATVAAETTVDAAFAELIVWPGGQTGRLFLTALYNHIDADAAVFRVRLGEQQPLARYRVGAVGGHYLFQRNLRGLVELGWDLDDERAILTAGFSAAF